MPDISYIKDTIAARATAPGKSGIGIVRVSGPAVPTIATALAGDLPKPRTAAYRKFLDGQGDVIDEGLLIYFKGPESFTGEDVLEFQGHGSPVVLDMLLNEIVSAGARLAKPGEFSERAFLNDKFDLAQAEAIADLIDSSTQQAARGAMQSLQGRFSTEINQLLAQVIELRVYVEAAIDFPEEEIDFLSDDRVKQMLFDLAATFKNLITNTKEATLLTEGASIVLLGPPNAGKSSLMNLLTGRDTSIVTEIPGTTRDVVDDQLQLDGIPLNLVDTAGIRQSDDVVEAEGIRRALKAAESADLVVILVDASQADDHAAFFDQLPKSSNRLLVYNKTDLDGVVVPSGELGLSALTGDGLDELKARLKEILGVGGSFSASGETAFTARRRHLDAVRRADQALMTGTIALLENEQGELLAEELRICQQFLGEITGEFTADDLLGEIFSSFCIGK